MSTLRFLYIASILAFTVVDRHLSYFDLDFHFTGYGFSTRTQRDRHHEQPSINRYHTQKEKTHSKRQKKHRKTKPDNTFFMFSAFFFQFVWVFPPFEDVCNLRFSPWINCWSCGVAWTPKSPKGHGPGCAPRGCRGWPKRGENDGGHRWKARRCLIMGMGGER